LPLCGRDLSGRAFRRTTAPIFEPDTNPPLQRPLVNANQTTDNLSSATLALSLKAQGEDSLLDVRL